MPNSEIVDGKTILITGGTGSFGKVFIRDLLTNHNPEKVIVFSRDELKQWEMRQADPLFDHERIRYFLGDVRDRDRLELAFREVDYVVHAAALKQVPAAEYNPTEFIKTNVDGATNIISAAIICRVEKVIAFSTDKACNPVNLYGATKLCSDKLFVAANSYVGNLGKPRFSVARYGNVLGSRGSIVLRWRSMVEAGAERLPVTDERMTRFWITIEQASQFIIDNLGRMNGGEIFIPRIPSMKIVDLAKAVAPEFPIELVGIRPGEKLHEMMIGVDDARHSLALDDHFVVCPGPKDPLFEKLRKSGGTPLPDGFAYTSDTNDRWLEIPDLKNLLGI